jgi:hypothetical protein
MKTVWSGSPERGQQKHLSVLLSIESHFGKLTFSECTSAGIHPPTSRGGREDNFNPVGTNPSQSFKMLARRLNIYESKLFKINTRC